MHARLALPSALFAATVTLGVPAVSADLLVVLNKSDHEAVLVDPATLKPVARLATGRGPHEVAVSPDGRLAYVANYGMYGVFREGQRVNEPGRTLTVLDLEKRAIRDTIDLGSYAKPHGIAVSRDGRRLWVTCEDSQSVLELDAGSGAILKAWKTGQETSHMIAPAVDEAKLFVANIRAGTATIIERAADKVTSLTTAAGTEGVDVSPDGREVWFTNRADSSVSVLDARTDTLIAKLGSGGRFPIRVKFTPDGREAWVSCLQSNEVTVFDARSRRQIASIPVGKAPVGIQMAPDGKRAFVANTNDDLVTVIDVPGRKVLATFTTGNEPDGMAWATAPPQAPKATRAP
jgi:YVTN family beta-propeller protein